MNGWIQVDNERRWERRERRNSENTWLASLNHATRKWRASTDMRLGKPGLKKFKTYNRGKWNSKSNSNKSKQKTNLPVVNLWKKMKNPKDNFLSNARVLNKSLWRQRLIYKAPLNHFFTSVGHWKIDEVQCRTNLKSWPQKWGRFLKTNAKNI